MFHFAFLNSFPVNFFFTNVFDLSEEVTSAFMCNIEYNVSASFLFSIISNSCSCKIKLLICNHNTVYHYNVLNSQEIKNIFSLSGF